MTMTAAPLEVIIPADGVRTTWPFSFPDFYDPLQIDGNYLVLEVINAQGVHTLVAENEYTVTRTPTTDPKGVGGVVTYPINGGKVAAGNKIRLSTDIPLDQTSNFAVGSYPSGDKIMYAIDRNVAINKQTRKIAEQSLRLASGIVPTRDNTTLTPQANTLIGFDASSKLKLFPQGVSGGTGLTEDQTKTINILTSRYRPDRYAGFVGDGVASDQTAINAMIAAIEADIRDNIYIELHPDTTITGFIRLYAGWGYKRNVVVDCNSALVRHNTRLNAASSSVSNEAAICVERADLVRVINPRIDGTCKNKILSLTVSGTTATVVTEDPHNFVNNNYIFVNGVKTPQSIIATIPTGNALTDSLPIKNDSLNGGKRVTIVDATTFTFPCEAGVSATLDVANAWCSWRTPGTQFFGGDGIRLLDCRDWWIESPIIEHCNDHAWHIVSTTNSANIQYSAGITDNMKPSAGKGFITNATVRNCTQTSFTPSGAEMVIVDGLLAEGLRAGSVKFAAGLKDGGNVIINNYMARDFSDIGPAITPNALIIEGGQNYIIDNFTWERVGGLVALSNPGSNRPGRKQLTDISLTNGTMRDTGFAYKLSNNRSFHGVTLGDRTETVGADAVANIQVKNVKFYDILGRGVSMVDNNQGEHVNISVEDCHFEDVALQAVYDTIRKARRVKLKNITVRKENATKNINAWVSGTTYNVFDFVYNATEKSFFRKSSGGLQVSTVLPTEATSDKALADGITWKFQGFNNAINVGAEFLGVGDFNENLTMDDLDVQVWQGANAVDIASYTKPTLQNSRINGIINIGNTREMWCENNEISGRINCGNNYKATFTRNTIDCLGQAVKAINLNNDEETTIRDNHFVNNASTTGVIGIDLENILNPIIEGNTFENCTNHELFAGKLVHANQVLKAKISYEAPTGITNQTNTLFTPGGVITNNAPSPGRAMAIKPTSRGPSSYRIAAEHLSDNTNNYGVDTRFRLSGTYTSGAFTGSPAYNATGQNPQFKIVLNPGSGTSTGSSEPAVNLFGIPDGSNIDACAHWRWLSWNYLNFQRWQAGINVTFGYNSKASGLPETNGCTVARVITGGSYNPATGVVTLMVPSDDLVNGEFYTIANMYPGQNNNQEYPTTSVGRLSNPNYNRRADSDTNGIKDSNPVTVIDSGTISYNIGTGGAIQPAFGIVMTFEPPDGLSDPVIIGGCTLTSSGTTATLTTPVNHGRTTGQLISIRMCTDSVYNVSYKSATVTSPTQLTFTLDSVPASSTAVALERLVVLGSYLSVAPNARVTGDGTPAEPSGRGFDWGGYKCEWIYPYPLTQPIRENVVPYRQRLSLSSGTLGTINAGATFTSSAQTLSGIATHMRGLAIAISGSTGGLEVSAVPTAANTYVLVLRNVTGSNITPGSSVFEVTFFDERPWSTTGAVVR